MTEPASSRTLPRRVLSTGSVAGLAFKDGLLDGAAHTSVLAVSQKLRERFPVLASEDFDEVVPFAASILLVALGEVGEGLIPKADLLSALGSRALRAHTSKVSTSFFADLLAMVGVALDGVPANLEGLLRAEAAAADVAETTVESVVGAGEVGVEEAEEEEAEHDEGDETP
jgi:hypothetical protein